MSVTERIIEAAHQLVTAADEDEYLHALTVLRDEIAATAEADFGGGVINELIGGYVA